MTKECFAPWFWTRIGLGTRWNLIVALFVGSLTACQPGLSIEFLNNSGQNLTLIILDRALVGTRYPAPNLQTAKTGVPYKLRIERQDAVWDYNLPAQPLPDEYRTRLGLAGYAERFQIESNGFIYALPAGSSRLTDLSRQPDGWPVRPKA